jgi:hypothetical protein
MTPFKSPLLLTVPPTLEKKLEALAALRTLEAQDEELVRQRRVAIAALRRDFDELQRDFATLRRRLATDVRSDAMRALKYNPDQPRVPKGNPEGGQWTSEDGSSSSPGSMARPVSEEHPSSGRGPQYAALETDTRTDETASNVPDEHGNANTFSNQYAAITVERYDRTGDERIDRTSDVLFQALVRDEELVDRALVLLGKIGPALYGTLVHLAFAADVKWQDIPGIGSDGVEQSFSLGDIVRYGSNGSIRTDVVLRDEDGNIIAVWDVKTGNAELTDARRQEIREELNLSDNIPIIDLHICRGRKLQNERRVWFGLAVQNRSYALSRHPGSAGRSLSCRHCCMASSTEARNSEGWSNCAARSVFLARSAICH